MPTGFKHTVKCRCVLPQFKRVADPPTHQFVVFSVLGDDDVIIPKFAQCNNCGLVHKVIEINKSEIIHNRESMSSIMSVNDIKQSLPDKFVTLLDVNKVIDIATWEQAQFIFENQRWGDFVVLTTDTESGVKTGKYVRILGETLYKIESFAREEVIR